MKLPRADNLHVNVIEQSADCYTQEQQRQQASNYSEHSLILTATNGVKRISERSKDQAEISAVHP